MMNKLVRVKAAHPLERFRVHVEFDDGTSREVDLEPYLHGPIFDPLRRDPILFRAMKVDGGVITWENGADIDPDVLYYGLTPAWVEKEHV